MSETPGGRRRADGDVPPTHTEADAQRAQRTMPLVWMVLGLIVIAIFAFALLGAGRFFHGGPASPGPSRMPGAGAAPSLASSARPR